jgi:amidase
MLRVMPDLAFASASHLSRLVAARDVSPVELVDLFLERIERIDPHLGSVVTLDAERAREAARQAQERAGADDAPPFLGVPILIKDLHLTEGLRTTLGTRSFADFVPPFDEENVARIRRAGFIFLGKTNVPEFGTLPITESALLGPCRNPWDRGLTPGGSSGGAGAALAAGLSPVAHGSDGGGSCRYPASNCGLIGLKPARGRISAAPLFGEMVSGLSTPGPIARYVEDAAALLDIMSGYAVGDPYWAPPPPRPYVEEVRREPPPLRVGLVTTSPLSTFQPETVAAAQAAAALLTDLGHHVEPFHPTAVTEQFKADFELLWAAGLAAVPVDPATLEPFNASLVAMIAQRSATDFIRAQHSLQLQARSIVGTCSAFDVVLSPTQAELPLKIGELADLEDARAMFDRLTQYVGIAPVANVTGQPSVSLPLHWSDDGVPVGVMLTGRPCDEATLLRLAAQLQQVCDWPARRPPIS